MTDEKVGEVVSFPEASNPHVLARNDAKLKKVQENELSRSIAEI